MEFLLTDDNEIALEIEKLMLESCGLSVTTASSGEEAVELAMEKQFFMIFMDIHMPGIDGFTAAEQIRRNDPNVHIIALSADPIDENDEAFVKSGMNDALLKPLQSDDLNKLLGQYLDTGMNSSRSSDGENEVFSYDSLLSVIKDENAILRLLKQFLNVHTEDCRMINEHIKNNELLPAREILHNVIGISGNLFCNKLYRISRDLSNELKREAHTSLDSFNQAWDEAIEVLSEYRRRLTENEPENEAVENWDQLRESFNALCREFDVSTADIFSENIKTFRAKMAPEKFTALKDAVFSYDYLWITDNMEVLYV